MYTEDAIIKNYNKNLNYTKKPKEKKERKTSLPGIKFDVTHTRNDFSSKHDSSLISDLNNSITTKQEYCLFSDVKYFVKNITFLLTDDDLFDAAIKEYMNINEYPTDIKDKFNFVKKIIPIYKKLRDDDKIDTFIIKMSDKLSEKRDDVKKIFEIMYNRERRERLTATINKLLSKFVTSFERITDYSDMSRLFGLRDFSDKFKPIQEKIDMFMKITGDIK